MNAEQFQRIAKALADPRRFEILEHIAKQSEVGCQRLCGCFPVRQATISHHLKELASAGLVESRRDGQFVYYRLRPSVFETYMAELRRKMSPRGAASATNGTGATAGKGGTGAAKVTVHEAPEVAPAAAVRSARAKTPRRKSTAAERA